MEFTPVGDGDLGAPVQDVAQEAIDATATRYARTPGIEVNEHRGPLQQIQGDGLFAGQRWHSAIHSVLRRQTPAWS